MDCYDPGIGAANERAHRCTIQKIRKIGFSALGSNPYQAPFPASVFDVCICPLFHTIHRCESNTVRSDGFSFHASITRIVLVQIKRFDIGVCSLSIHGNYAISVTIY